MDFRPDPGAARLRAETRALIEEHITQAVRDRIHETGTVYDAPFHKALVEKGWLTAGWPPEDGGQGRSALELSPFFEEAALLDAPLDAILTTMLVGESLRRVGSARQREEILAPIVAGDLMVCLGLSEPDSGSDVSAARTRAVRDGDEWVIDGQKMFTTMGHEADYVYLLTRTDPAAAKHRGLTMFLVPMDAPGIEVQAVRTLGGERTNITYYSDVRVPDWLRVGDVDGGWATLLVTLAFERAMVPTAATRCQRVSALVADWATSADEVGHRPVDDAATRSVVADMAMRTEVARLLGQRCVWAHAAGRTPVTEGSMAKLYAAELLQRLASQAIDLIGADATIPEHHEGAVLDGALERTFRHAPVEGIYGGTNEVQRNILAEQLLGLPRPS